MKIFYVLYKWPPTDDAHKTFETQLSSFCMKIYNKQYILGANGASNNYSQCD